MNIAAKKYGSHGLWQAYGMHCIIIALNQNITVYYNVFNLSSRFIYCLWESV